MPGGPPAPLPDHPLPAEPTPGGQVGGGRYSKLSSEGQPQLVCWGSWALGRVRKGEVRGSSPVWASGTEW